MAGMPIPQDWVEADGFCCEVVEWPNSPEWRTLLSGLLLYPSVGRFWDAETGIIVDAQEIGKLIEERNPTFFNPDCS
jgi:hypothetical protein